METTKVFKRIREFKPRNKWSKRSELALLDLWEQYIDQLRGARQNGHVYMKMAAEMTKLGFPCSAKEIKTKLHNLTAKYRKEKAVMGPSNSNSASSMCPSEDFISSIETEPQSPSAASSSSSVDIPKLSARSSSSTSRPRESEKKINICKKILDEIKRGEIETNKQLEEISREIKETREAMMKRDETRNNIMKELLASTVAMQEAFVNFLNSN